MVQTIQRVLQHRLAQILEKIYHIKDLPLENLVRWSDRPDLSDFQSNVPLMLAKRLKMSPREIGQHLQNELNQEDFDLSLDGPGFLNFKVRESFLTHQTNLLALDKNWGVSRPASQKIFLDYGGPNVAKPLHVGHLRSVILGESLKRLFQFLGHEVVCDVHLGDWGLPMGLILAHLEEEPSFQTFFSVEKADDFQISFDDLVKIYPLASQRAKTDEGFLEKARDRTRRLQAGDSVFRSIWRVCRELSVQKIKETFDLLGASFDYWFGESDVHSKIKPLVEMLQKLNLAVVSQGAVVVDFEKLGVDLPVYIVEKSDGAVLYTSTDFATLEQRFQDHKPDQILYVVDVRQSLHFQQLFKLADLASVKHQMHLEHVGFGTINGPDGKPFKTRSGAGATLDFLLTQAIEQIQERVKDRPYSDEEKEEIAKKVGLAAVKFADLMNPRESNYKFDEKKFGFEGKTGPYCLYTIARTYSLLLKSDKLGLKAAGDLKEPVHETEKHLYLVFHRFADVIEQSAKGRHPHLLCDYLFLLAQAYNQFYFACPILKETNLNLQSSRLYLTQLVQNLLEKICDLLGLDVVHQM
jgi:arginyl-tRNA synthetase